MAIECRVELTKWAQSKVDELSLGDGNKYYLRYQQLIASIKEICKTQEPVSADITGEYWAKYFDGQNEDARTILQGFQEAKEVLVEVSYHELQFVRLIEYVYYTEFAFGFKVKVHLKGLPHGFYFPVDVGSYLERIGLSEYASYSSKT